MKQIIIIIVIFLPIFSPTNIFTFSCSWIESRSKITRYQDSKMYYNKM